MQLLDSFNAGFKPLQVKPLHTPVGDQYHSCELSQLMGYSFRNIGISIPPFLQVPYGPSFGLRHLKYI